MDSFKTDLLVSFRTRVKSAIPDFYICCFCPCLNQLTLSSNVKSFPLYYVMVRLHFLLLSLLQEATLGLQQLARLDGFEKESKQEKVKLHVGLLHQLKLRKESKAQLDKMVPQAENTFKFNRSRQREKNLYRKDRRTRPDGTSLLCYQTWIDQLRDHYGTQANLPGQTKSMPPYSPSLRWRARQRREHGLSRSGIMTHGPPHSPSEQRKM